MSLHVRIMPTFLVQVLINNEPIGLARALGDSGSEAELVHHDTIAPWYKFSKPANVTVVGLGEQDVLVKRKIEVELRPWYDQSDQTKLKVTLWILPQTNKWAPVYPERPIPRNAIDSPLNGQLADPLFWDPARVQILLGIEVIAMLLMDSYAKRIGKRIIQQETAFGTLAVSFSDRLAIGSALTHRN